MVRVYPWRIQGAIITLRKVIGSGDSPGLQSRRLLLWGSDGFDSHDLPPIHASEESVAGKRRRVFRAAKEVRAIARERLGAPKPSRVIEDPRKAKSPKHKKRLLREMENE